MHTSKDADPELRQRPYSQRRPRGEHKTRLGAQTAGRSVNSTPSDFFTPAMSQTFPDRLLSSWQVSAPPTVTAPQAPSRPTVSSSPPWKKTPDWRSIHLISSLIASQRLSSTFFVFLCSSSGFPSRLPSVVVPVIRVPTIYPPVTHLYP